MSVNLSDIKVAKSIKVRAFDSCDQIADNKYSLTGAVSHDEAKMLEGALRLYRREVGSLGPDELQLASALLILKAGR